jgi:menaquinone-dependent protoporphyrinogen oxidase
MARVLIVYGTTEGHTAEIAERMAAAMRTAGHVVDLRDSKTVRKETVGGDFDGIVVGGSVHAGDFQSSLKEFVKRNLEGLERTPSAFFSVSLSAADPDEESTAETRGVQEKFFLETGWRPEKVEAIAGALVYTQYNIFIRHVMKLIVKSHGRSELDTSRDFDFTNWERVDTFARDFANSLAATV